MRFHRLITLFTFLLAGIQLMAVPARRNVRIVQPDGRAIDCILRGDERLKILTDLQGHSLIQGEDGFYRYSRFDADGTRHSTGYIAGEDAPAYILSQSSTIPYAALSLAAKKSVLNNVGGKSMLETKGDGEAKTKRCIVLLAQFTDIKMSYTRQNFVDMITGKGYSYNGAEGSVLDYFNDQLDGEFSFTFDIGPIVTLSKRQKDYGGNDDSGSDKNVAGAIQEACMLSSAAGVDFSKYDDDSDGEVDNVFVMVAGKNEADGGGDDCVWAQRWFLYDGAHISLTINGKRINSFAISSEMSYNRGRKDFEFATIGTFCHEYSHVLGLKDMYDTDGIASGGEADCLWGTTSVMDTGCYNNEGNTPPHYGAIDYDTIGCGDESELTAGTHSLAPIRTGRKFFKVSGENSGEYYLLECRDNEGWDKHIGGIGLAIYHIDKSTGNAGYSDEYSKDLTAQMRWVYDEVNCRPDHQCADMVETVTSASGAYEAFFPYGTASSFTPETTPAFRFWDGTAAGIALSGITSDGSSVTFKAADSKDFMIPDIKNLSTEVFQREVIVKWIASNPAFTGKSTVRWGLSDGVQKEVAVSSYGDGKFAFRAEGLEPRTAYKLAVRFSSENMDGNEESANFTTKSLYDDSIPFIFLNNVTRNTDGSMAVDTALPLVVYNIEDTSDVKWYFNGSQINTGEDGYWHATASGILKAVIKNSNGETTTIRKEITVR